MDGDFKPNSYKYLNQLAMKNQLLKEYIQTLKKNGFRVYAFQEESQISQVFFEKNGKIGTVYQDFGYLNFSSVHYPQKEIGTGFGTFREVFNPTLEHAEKTINTTNVKWCKTLVKRKYTSFEEYKNTQINRILTYAEI